MLVLTRKLDEEIIIGNNIRIMIVEVSGDRVRLGIEAPSDIPVDRLEVRESKMREGIRRPQAA